MSKLKKVLAFSLALVLAFSMTSFGLAFAEQGDTTAQDQQAVGDQTSADKDAAVQTADAPAADATAADALATDTPAAGAPAADTQTADAQDSANQAAPADATGSQVAPLADDTTTSQGTAGSIEVDPADAIGYVYLDNTMLALGQTQNIAFGLLDESAVLTQATLTLTKTSTGVSTDYTATTLADNAALFSIAFTDNQDADGYYVTRITYCTSGSDNTYSADLSSLGAEPDNNSYYFDVVSAQLADALNAAPAESGDVTALAVTDDGSLVATDTIQDALDIASGDSSLADTGVALTPLAASTDSTAPAASTAATPSTASTASTASPLSPQSYLMVALDPGHGAGDTGAVSGSLVEKDLNWKIANACQNELLTYAGVGVMLTRAQDENPSLQTRVDRAVAAGANVFISLHCNSGGGTGSEVWIPNNSSYLNADTHGVGAALGTQILAQLSKLGLANRGLKSSNSTNGSKYPDGSIADYYSVINDARMAGIPGIIVEHAFVDNSADAAKLQDDSFLTQLGKADATGIALQYGLTKLKPSSTPSVVYKAHVQKIGWQGNVKDGTTAGTTGQALRMEALQITLSNLPVTGGIQYNAHVQGIGWQGWVSDGDTAGTTGKALRMEAIQIQLIGDMANNYDVYYRAHVQGIGWMGWAKNGASAGSMGCALRMEAIQIQLVKKGGKAPGSTTTPFKSASAVDVITYQAHVQSIGWQNAVQSGATAGTTGKALRMEALKVSLTNQQFFGDILYSANCTGLGWQAWKKDGAIAGTTGQSRPMETIKMELTGDIAARYDIYYRVHVQNIGWMGWTSNGANAGTNGYGYRIEAIQIKLVKKGGAAPGSTAGSFVDKNASGVTNTPIMGSSGTTVAQMVRYFNASGHAYPSAAYASKGAPDIQTFCQIVYDEATAEGVRPEVVFCQAMKETGWLGFGGIVKVGQCNFGGLGATSSTATGATFADVRTGIRAQVQHLKAYAVPGLKTSDLKNPCVDPRFDLVSKGSATTLEALDGKWAVPGVGYGEAIAKMIGDLYKA